MAALNAGSAIVRVTIPRMPFVPPPSNPRELPGWYDRFYAQHVQWVEQVNQALVGQTPADTLAAS